MMTPKRRRQEPPRPQCHLTSPLLTWQRLVLGGYSALLALFLPVICWGAAAEPGHPHRYPHFVFAEPPNPAQHPQPAIHAPMHETRALSAHQPGSYEAAPMAKAPATCSLHPDGVIAGRATPTLMVFAILLLLVLGEWLVRRLHWPPLVLWRCLYFPEALSLPVPLPPPRLCRAGL